MANHKSALKRARQSNKKHTRNVAIKSTMKSEINKALEAINNAASKDAALTALSTAEKIIRKAASKGAIPVERASRKTSRLAALVIKKFDKTSPAHK